MSSPATSDICFNISDNFWKQTYCSQRGGCIPIYKYYESRKLRIDSGDVEATRGEFGVIKDAFDEI